MSLPGEGPLSACLLTIQRDKSSRVIFGDSLWRNLQLIFLPKHIAPETLWMWLSLAKELNKSGFGNRFPQGSRIVEDVSSKCSENGHC